MGAAALLGVDGGSVSRDAGRYAGRRGAAVGGIASGLGGVRGDVRGFPVDVPGERTFVRVPSSMPVLSRARMEGLGIWK
jgi:hypothetical protein